MMIQLCRALGLHTTTVRRSLLPLVRSAGVLRAFMVGMALAVVACGRDVISVELGGLSLSVSSGTSVAAIDSWRVTVSGPSGSQTRTGNSGSTIEFGELQPGSYSVLLEGFEGADLASRGQTSVTVQAGGNATANVSVSPVLPELTVVASDPAASEVGPDQGTFTISRTGPSSAALVISVAVSGTATAGTDYQSIASTFTMGSGQRSITVNVVPNTDAVAEGIETVVLNIGSGSGYTVGAPASATVSIADALVPSVTVTAFDDAASEIGPNTGTFRISRSGASTASLAVSVALSGSAVNGTDYQSIATTQTIPVGVTFVDVTVNPVLDGIQEGAETAVITVVTGAGYTVGVPASATVTIADGPVVTVVASDAIASEVGLDPGTFAISRTDVTSALTVGLTISGTATPGTDYVAIGSSVTMPAGQASISVTVTPVADGISEGTETVVLAIAANPTAYAVGTPNTATVSIVDTPLPTVAAGSNHTCGLTGAGVAYCWGRNDVGQLGDGSTTDKATPVAVAGGRTFISLAAGQYHTCGLTSTGATYCWGSNYLGQLGDGSTSSNTTPTAVAGGRTFISLAAGFNHTCGLTSTGVAYCWGDNSSGQLGDGSTSNKTAPAAVAGGRTFISLSAGRYHTCGLTSTGAAYCWGGNPQGQLGNGSSNGDKTEPGAVLGGLTFVSLSAGYDHTCALTSTGAGYCWGYNYEGQLGEGSTNSQKSAPTAVGGGLILISLAAGEDHTCGLTSLGAAYCWGANSYEQLGDGSSSNKTTPAAVAGGRTFVSLAAGSGHTCGLTSTGLGYCWGVNRFGQLGDGSTSEKKAPAAVAGGRTFNSLSTGWNHTCAVTSSGVGYCWGNNSYGVLGDGSTSNKTAPTALAGGLTFKSLAAGFSHTCGLTSTGAAYCWGYNGGGGLGDGSTSDKTTPTAVTGGRTFVSLSAGSSHTCGLTSSGVAYCWGNNHEGQLGDGSTTDRTAPTAVVGGRTFVSLDAGFDHTCGLTSTGAAYCWGSDWAGQLGDGGLVDKTAPTVVGGDRTYASLSAGFFHTCGLTSTGVAYCWGLNLYGELGIASTSSITTDPAAVLGGRTFGSLSAGSDHTCGLTSTGAGYCWGRNNHGQLGDGSPSDWREPTAVLGGRTFVSLGAGGAHTCGLTSTAAGYCWGDDQYGQVGVGRAIGFPVAVIGGIIFKVP